MDEVARYEKLKEEKSRLSDKKVRLEERLSSKKEELEKLISEIKGKGYDPKNLASVKEEKSAELQSGLEKIENDLNEISEKLNEIEV